MDIKPKRSTLNLNPNGSVKEAKHQHHVITHDDGAATCVSIDDMDLDPRQVPRIPVNFGKYRSCSATKNLSLRPLPVFQVFSS